MSASRRQAFETLGLPPNADSQAIRKAFRALSRTHHPDLGGDPETYQAITTAYTVLTDTAAAAQADTAAARAATAQPPASPSARSKSAPSTQRAAQTRHASGASGAASRANSTAAHNTDNRYTPSGPASQDVTYDGAHPALSERDAHTLVRGSIRRRSLFDRAVYREARTAAVMDLFERIHEHVPAARMVLGVRIDGTDIEAVIFAGHRLLAVDVEASVDAEHAWDGTTLRANGKPLAYTPDHDAVHALERKIGGSRAEALHVLFVPGRSAQHPVVNRVGATAGVTGPSPIARAAGEGIAYLAGGPNPSSINLSVYGQLLQFAGRDTHKKNTVP
ncbi:DnaJ domain-containing protein [Pseudoglutamicibacter albus]|uniref:DnaJ domain-containing protein n=1 Tax=Pseudoglutamicibacter albus TaxID=98671 RepID=UPI001EF65D80|nr:DnaJ domain-containing protein [Pseudoglutamicibacter albus]MCG7304715.1 DnaJ domain-containing protein [Pseudoglutamicibacter albus]